MLIYYSSIIFRFSEVGEDKDVTPRIWMDLHVGLSAITWLVLHVGFLIMQTENCLILF